MATSWLFFLDGQSNGGGDGPVAGASAETLALLEPVGPKYWSVLDGDTAWGPVLISAKQADHIGPEHTLARDIYDNLPAGDSIYLFDACDLGSSMNGKHEPTNANQGTWDSISAALQDAIDLIPGKVSFGGMVWVQGEGDAGTEAFANAYEAALESFYKFYLGNLSLDIVNAPFVCYRLPTWQSYTYLSTVRAAQDALGAAHNNVTVIDTDSTTDNGDGTHLDADSQAAMGSAYAVPIIAYISAADTSGEPAKDSPVIRSAPVAYTASASWKPGFTGFSSPQSTDEWLMQDQTGGSYANEVGSETLDNENGAVDQTATDIDDGAGTGNRLYWVADENTKRLVSSGNTAGDSDGDSFSFRLVFQGTDLWIANDYPISKTLDGSKGWWLVPGGGNLRFDVNDGSLSVRASMPGIDATGYNDGNPHYISGHYNATTGEVKMKSDLFDEVRDPTPTVLASVAVAAPLKVNGYWVSSRGTEGIGVHSFGVCVGDDSSVHYGEDFWDHDNL